MSRLIKIKEIMFEEDIRLCKICGGDGQVVDDSWGSGASDMVNCNTCAGDGRTKRVMCKAFVDVPFNYKVGDKV